MLGAAKLVQARGVSTFDAAYAALAASLGAEFATADRRLANALGGAVDCILL
jgi:predicted nucleic acid-binding protein